MEEEPSEALPGEVEEEEPPRTSSTALEVEEEIVLPTSSSTEAEKDATGPASTPLDGEEDLKETSRPSSEREETSESVVPQVQSPSEMSSSLPLEDSEGLWSSIPSSPSLSPLPLKVNQDVLQPAEHEEGSEGTEKAMASLTKKKMKKAVAKKGTTNYTVRPIVPAEKGELLSVAKAMHRDNFGRNVKELFHLEKEAALKSMETGLYIGWRCPEYLWDCFRVGDESKCFCGHLLKQHQIYVGCSCTAFASSFLCAACDRRWEEHETFFELEETRRKGGRPYGEAYLPFAEMPELRNAVLTGRSEDNSTRQALQAQTQGLPVPSGSRALPLPPSGPPRRIMDKDDKKA